MSAFRSFLVDWRVKAAAFRLFYHLPGGDQMYHFFQANITKSIPRNMDSVTEMAEHPIAHARRLQECFPHVGDIHILEIGAGWDLLANLIYYCYGINRQTTVDIVNLATSEAVNAVISALQDSPPPGAIRRPQANVRGASLREDLEKLYGITYFAPMDVRVSGLPDKSIDAILTTSVLEHIPSAELHGIFAEFRRILKPDGLMRHRVDYSDHYSHSDPAISPFNMLRYNERVWQLFSPPNHFQNRWKTPDYLKLFQATGFGVVRCDEVCGDLDVLAKTPLHRKFASQDKDDLSKLSAAFELK